MLFIILIIFLTIMASLFFLMNILLSKKSTTNREKSSPFECGFDPLSKSRIPFSIQFFLISLIFLIFDIEISLLIPLIYMSTFMNKTLIFVSLTFMILLILGLFIEYSEKSIDWKL